MPKPNGRGVPVKVGPKTSTVELAEFERHEAEVVRDIVPGGGDFGVYVARGGSRSEKITFRFRSA